MRGKGSPAYRHGRCVVKPDKPDRDETYGRLFHVGAAAAVAVAVAGVLTNFRTTPESHPRHEVRRTLADETAPVAPTYRQLSEMRFSENRRRHADNLVAMAARPPNAQDLPPVDDAVRAATLAHRSERRAYDGAPPVIPHPIDQGSYPNCTACHSTGMMVGNRFAPAMSHPVYASCTQCHAPVTGGFPFAIGSDGPPVDNTFAGTRAPDHGERAWPGAPPTIPHRTWMRENCSSCHGAVSSGIRSSHPYRQSCTQCHAPSAALDQRSQPLEAAR
jgi:nitrate reductase (cytochrome), electron transfer subunit